jgi:hypothetical protein
MVNDNIINNINISTIMILPTFQPILDEYNSKKTRNAIYTVITLFYECGLINCYLYDSKSTDHNLTLKLVFNKEKLTTKIIDNKKSYFSLFDIITLSTWFVKLENLNEEEVVIYLKIDKKWEEDIKLIENSNYSKVSNEYKECIKFDSKYNVELSSNKDANTIVLENLAANIAYKTKELLKAVNKLYNTNVSDSLEVYKEFNKEKETIILK